MFLPSFLFSNNCLEHFIGKSQLQRDIFYKAYQVDVFFITGRTADEKNATIKNLEHAGFKHWAGLYLLNKKLEPNYNNIESFKIATRKMLTEKGYDILLSMGDKPTDFSGGYAHASFKLPNPYY